MRNRRGKFMRFLLGLTAGNVALAAMAPTILKACCCYVGGEVVCSGNTCEGDGKVCKCSGSGTCSS
jgi:hypothetical protein